MPARMQAQIFHAGFGLQWFPPCEDMSRLPHALYQSIERLRSTRIRSRVLPTNWEHNPCSTAMWYGVNAHCLQDLRWVQPFKQRRRESGYGVSHIPLSKVAAWLWWIQKDLVTQWRYHMGQSVWNQPNFRHFPTFHFWFGCNFVHLFANHFWAQIPNFMKISWKLTELHHSKWRWGRRKFGPDFATCYPEPLSKWNNSRSIVDRNMGSSLL